MSAALERFSKPYTFHRYGRQVIDNGKLKRPVEVLNDGQPFTMVAAIQRLKEFEAQLLPEGLRNRASIKLWTLTPMNVLDEKKGIFGDRLTWKGTLYEVMAVDDWTDGPLDHRRYLAFKVENA